MSDDQAPAQSLEDRIAAQFGAVDEPEVEQQEASAEPEPEAQPSEEVAEPESTSSDYEEVEYEGSKYQVPKELAKAIMQERDYTQKTQQIAEQRRAVELQSKEFALLHEQRKFQESIAGDLDNLKMLDAYIKHVEQSTDWSKLSTDQIVRARLELDQYRNQAQALAQAVEGKRTEFTGKLQAEREKLKKETTETLAKAIPSWSDETKGAVEKYVGTLGYPDVGVQNMSALDYQVAWKAMQYDRLQSEKGAAVVKASKAPPIVKTGPSNPMPQQVKEKLAYRKAIKKPGLSSQDKAKLIQARLEQQFGG